MQVGHRRRVRRAARGAALLPAARLRRRRGEPVPRLRDAPRHGRRGHPEGRRRRRGRQELREGARQGRPQGHDQDGDLDAPELPRRADLRGDRPRLARSSTATSPGPRRASRASASTCIAREAAAAPRPRLQGRRRRSTATSTSAGSTSGGAAASTTCTTRTRSRKLQHAVRAGSYKMFKEYTAAANDESRRLCTIRGLLELQAGHPDPARRGRAGDRDREALQDGRHVARLDQPRGAREPRHRDEPDRRQVEHRRGRRGSGPLHARPERRLAPQRDQAGRVGPLRRHELLPRQLRRAADQDGAGREARRGRPAPRPQGRRVHRQDPLLDAGRRPHLAAAAPRHLLDRGPGAADPRPEELEQPRPHQREARRRGGRRHGRRRRLQGEGRRRPHQRRLGRHRRLAAHVDQARRHPVGARASPRRSRCWSPTTCAAASASRPTGS